MSGLACDVAPPTAGGPLHLQRTLPLWHVGEHPTQEGQQVRQLECAERSR
jgi:hypothetical protein